MFRWQCHICAAEDRVRPGSKDFDDESLLDTLTDLANYCLLWVGYEKDNS